MPRNSEVRAAVETLRAAGAASTDAQLKSRLKTTERLFLALVRQVDYEKRRGAAEVKALRSELHDELIAREAALRASPSASAQLTLRQRFPRASRPSRAPSPGAHSSKRRCARSTSTP